MANHKSAAKRAKQTISKTAHNSRIKKTVRTFEKKLRKAIEAKETDQAQTLFREFSSKIAKAAEKGIMHRNMASRKIGQLAKHLHQMSL